MTSCVPAFPVNRSPRPETRKGLECPQWGDLIHYVIRILKYRKPALFIIENVPNLVRHNEGRTWADIKKGLKSAGYDLHERTLSPHMFGIPQIRERRFIVGGPGNLDNFSWPELDETSKLCIRSVLDEHPDGARPLPDKFIEYLEAWQEFLNCFPKDEELPSFPIWAMEFGATYPYRNSTPYAQNNRGLGRYLGSFSQPLRDLSPDKVREALPPYARDEVATFADWKIEFIQKNREFYLRHRGFIDPWLARIRAFAPSFQKLEWNCKGCERDIWKYVIQFRASGIRVKRPTTAPSLVAMTTSQVPVIAWERRYMTPRECSRLQSMGGLANLPIVKGAAYKALGNAVNSTVVELIASGLIAAHERGQNRMAREKVQRPRVDEGAVAHAA